MKKKRGSDGRDGKKVAILQLYLLHKQIQRTRCYLQRKKSARGNKRCEGTQETGVAKETLPRKILPDICAKRMAKSGMDSSNCAM